MSITLKNNKVIISQEVDLTPILERIQESENNVDYYSISREVKQQVLVDIISKLEKAVVAKLNLAKKVEDADWSEYEKVIDGKVANLIQTTIEDKVNKEIEKFIASRYKGSEFDKLVESVINKHFTDHIHPRIVNLMNAMIHINPVHVDDMIEGLESNLSDAYNAGGEAAANSIRNSI